MNCRLCSKPFPLEPLSERPVLRWVCWVRTFRSSTPGYYPTWTACGSRHWNLWIFQWDLFVILPSYHTTLRQVAISHFNWWSKRYWDTFYPQDTGNGYWNQPGPFIKKFLGYTTFLTGTNVTRQLPLSLLVYFPALTETLSDWFNAAIVLSLGPLRLCCVCEDDATVNNDMCTCTGKTSTRSCFIMLLHRIKPEPKLHGSRTLPSRQARSHLDSRWKRATRLEKKWTAYLFRSALLNHWSLESGIQQLWSVAQLCTRKVGDFCTGMNGYS